MIYKNNFKLKNGPKNHSVMSVTHIITFFQLFNPNFELNTLSFIEFFKVSRSVYKLFINKSYYFLLSFKYKQN